MRIVTYFQWELWGLGIGFGFDISYWYFGVEIGPFAIGIEVDR